MATRDYKLTTIHRCNDTPIRSTVHRVTSTRHTWSYRCLCGDSVFVGTDQLRAWNPDSKALAAAPHSL